jgi:hypothetical protein
VLPIAKAGVAYFALVFVLGFVLGTIRVLALTPRIGELASTLMELPIILTAAWIICAWLVKRFALVARWPARLGMGTIAFVLLMMAEAGLSVLVLGNRFEAYLGEFGTPAGVLGLGGQLVYAAFPLLQLRDRPAGLN